MLINLLLRGKNYKEEIDFLAVDGTKIHPALGGDDKEDKILESGDTRMGDGDVIAKAGTALLFALMELFKDEVLISKTANLSSITIKLPKENIKISGVYYFIFKKIAWEGINILEVISTTHEFTIILNDDDVDRAFTVLKGLKQE